MRCEVGGARGEEQPADPSRRDFLRTGTAIGPGSLLPSDPPRPSELAPQGSALFPAAPLDVVRIGFVGLGGQGSVPVENLLSLEGVEIRALCDIVPEKVSRWQQKIRDMGRPEPAGYDRGPRDFERLCAEPDLDLVFNATPWEWHVPIGLAAMRNGKHTAGLMGYMRTTCRRHSQGRWSPGRPIRNNPNTRPRKAGPNPRRISNRNSARRRSRSCCTGQRRTANIRFRSGNPHSTRGRTTGAREPTWAWAAPAGRSNPAIRSHGTRRIHPPETWHPSTYDALTTRFVATVHRSLFTVHW